MPAPRDPKHKLVALALFAGNTAEQASEAAGYNTKASSFAPNARKRARRKDIQSWLAELRAAPPTGEALKEIERAEIRREYLLAQTWDELQANIADYLSLDRRHFELSEVPRALMGRIEELSIVPGEHGTKVTVKLPSKLANRRFAAELQGYVKNRHEVTGKDGEPLTPVTEAVPENEQVRRVAHTLALLLEKPKKD